jgi:hypothetical protein
VLPSFSPHTLAFSFHLQASVSDDTTAAVLLLQHADGAVAITVADDKASVVNTGAKGAEAMTVTTFEEIDYIGVITRAAPDSDAVEVAFTPITGGEPMLKIAIESKLSTVSALFARLFRRNSDKELGMYSVATMADESVAAIRGSAATAGTVAWVREEGLADVNGVAFVDLPTEFADSVDTNVISRLATQVGGIGSVLGSIVSGGGMSTPL